MAADRYERVSNQIMMTSFMLNLLLLGGALLALLLKTEAARKVMRKSGN